MSIASGSSSAHSHAMASSTGQRERASCAKISAIDGESARESSNIFRTSAPVAAEPTNMEPRDITMGCSESPEGGDFMKSRPATVGATNSGIAVSLYILSPPNARSNGSRAGFRARRGRHCVPGRAHRQRSRRPCRRRSPQCRICPSVLPFQPMHRMSRHRRATNPPRHECALA